MKKYILYALTGLVLILNAYACSDEDKYSTSVVKEIKLFLNDKPWAVNTGLSTKPLFIYDSDGQYVANYSSLYRFQLPNGRYKIVSTTQSDSIPVAKNLNDIIIRQDLKGKVGHAISAPVDYNSPFTDPLTAKMYSRTGVVRLKATDKKADKSYSTVRAIISTPIYGYKLSDATYVKEPIEVSLDEPTKTGGVNYTKDIVLFETKTISENISIRIDYLNDNNQVVQSKAIDGAFQVLPNDTTQIAFALNKENEPIIQEYTVTIASEGWNDEELNPEAPLKIPEGYTYVSPEESLENICKSMMSDPEIQDVKLFLKAGSAYKLGRQTDIPKSLYIVAQAPQNGEEMTYMEMGNMSISTGDNTIDAVHFENINIKVTDSDFLKFKNQFFHVKEISLKNCEIRDLKRTMWYQEVNAPKAQVVDKFIIDGCRFFNLDHGGSAFIGLSTKQDAPIHNIVFRNSTFHAKNLTKGLISGLSSMTGDLNISIEHCTFLALAPANMRFFDLSPKKANNFMLTVKDNVFSGFSGADSGQWFNLGYVTSQSFSNNYCTQGFSLNDWGVETNDVPTETSSIEVLFKDVDALDFTIKDKTSEVYTKHIGDPYWINIK